MDCLPLIIAAVSAFAAVASAIFAGCSLRFSAKTNKSISELNKKQRTIEAVNRLQAVALDKLAVCSKQDVANTVDCLENSDCKDAYNNYRAIIAKIEHFATGVNEGVFDFDLVNKLVGAHLVFLYNKVEPIIKHARQFGEQRKYYYYEFEKLKEKLEETNKSIVVFLED